MQGRSTDRPCSRLRDRRITQVPIPAPERGPALAWAGRSAWVISSGG